MKKSVRFIKTVKPVFLIDEDKVIVQHEIKASKYVPIIIQYLLNDIYKFNDDDYIMCPHYKSGDFQIGITENCKVKEDTKQSVLRGINEEVGLNTNTPE